MTVAVAVLAAIALALALAWWRERARRRQCERRLARIHQRAENTLANLRQQR